MGSLRERLRLHHGKKENGPVRERPESRAAEMGETVSLPSGFSRRENGKGTYLFRREVFPPEFGSGRYTLGDLLDTDFDGMDLLTGSASPDVAVEDLLFFDIETTGLGTGAGNLIFLYGAGYFRGGGLVLEQYFLPDVHHEPALLEDFRRLADKHPVMVTYNGKGFDWTQVQTRMDLHRMSRKGEPLHCDLLYSARRLWRHRLPSCRMQEVEASCLGVKRQEDVPGFMAPVLYFEYLRSGDPGPLEGVFRHNRQDVLSLVHLLTHVLRILNGDWSPDHPEERLALAKWHLHRERQHDALTWLETVWNDPDASPHLRREAYREAATLMKRQGEWEIAVDLWHRWWKEDPWNPVPCVELAKYYEHRALQVEQALAWTRRALESVLRKKRITRSLTVKKELEELRHRERRLMKKRQSRLF